MNNSRRAWQFPLRLDLDEPRSVLEAEGSHWRLKTFRGAHGSCAFVLPVFELGMCVAHKCVCLG